MDDQVKHAKPERGWLSLSRDVNESIMLLLPDGSEIWVLVTSVEPGAAKICIHAPKEVQILREELLKRNDDE